MYVGIRSDQFGVLLTCKGWPYHLASIRPAFQVKTAYILSFSIKYFKPGIKYAYNLIENYENVRPWNKPRVINK